MNQGLMDRRKRIVDISKNVTGDFTDEEDLLYKAW